MASSLLDDRERDIVKQLDIHFSEKHLNYARAYVQIMHIISMEEFGILPKIYKSCVPGTERISKDSMIKLHELADKFSTYAVDDFHETVKKYEAIYNHDVKACEFAVRELVPDDCKELVHYLLTSEDVSNIAYAILLCNVLKPYCHQIGRLLRHLNDFARHADACLAIPARTHGQRAVPTTLRKRFTEFSHRIETAMDLLLNRDRLYVKFNGAVGNDNAVTALFTHVSFKEYAKKFISRLGFRHMTVNNQRSNHIDIANMFQTISLIQTIVKDIAQNIWMMVRDGYLTQIPNSNESGSSVMAHKTNPWHLEYAEGLFEQGIALCNGLIPGIICSRDERDLSDHPWERIYGQIITTFTLGNHYVGDFFQRIKINTVQIGQEMSDPAMNYMLSEVYVAALRSEGVPDGYDKIKEVTRTMSTNDSIKRTLDDMISQLLPYENQEPIRKRLRELEPNRYIGTANCSDHGGLESDIFSEYILGTTQHGPLRGVFHNRTIVIFDFDGTLVNTEKYVKDMIVRVYADQGISMDSDESARISALQKKNSDFDKLLEQIFEPHTHTQNVDSFKKIYRSSRFAGNLDYGVEPTNGAIEFVKYLKSKDIYTVILTNRVNLLSRRLTEAGFNTNDFMFFQPESNIRKPDPRVFEPIFRHCHSHIMTQYVFIGDHTDDMLSVQNLTFSDNMRVDFYPVLTGLSSREEFIEKYQSQTKIGESSQCKIYVDLHGIMAYFKGVFGN